MANAKAKSRRIDLRTVLLVSMVTLLVWLLAESRTVRTQIADLSPRLEVGTASGLVARPAPGFAWPESVKVTFSGSTAGLDQVVRSLQGRLELRVGIEVLATPGVHEIDMREVLRTSELIVTAGAGVVEVNPQRVRVEVDSLRETSLPVRIIEPDGVAFESNGRPTPMPGALRVRGPSSVLARLEGAEGLVRLDPALVAGLTPGRAETLGRLRVEVPEDQDRWATRFEPDYVDVALTLRSRTQSLVLSSMPVQIQLAPGEVGRWRVSLPPGGQDLVGVEVTGPSDQIERLRSGQLVPEAVVTLSFDELERGIESKEAQVMGLPTGVQISPEANLMVRLGIQRIGREENGG
ncbi:MAG: hypothetical protein LAT64_10995 [Phycisphaerales bacterium]|nr:hypothetical protein [Planctomycetota bacterium]MCH8509277.1 hypothetical protein [Phycisphaerales bacterium]